VELEGGTDEVSLIGLPCLLAIQTGINEPRYVSVMGIRKAAKKEIRVLTTEDLGLGTRDLEPDMLVEGLSYPPETGGAQMLSGDPKTIAEKILKILKEKGVIQ
jgi:electron transfer flavoprotein beta subunit